MWGMARADETEVLPSSEARRKLPGLIKGFVDDPERTVVIGRQRKREAVMLSASRFDEMTRVNELARDIAWAEFARERAENPTSEPVSWDEAQRRRA